MNNKKDENREGTGALSAIIFLILSTVLMFVIAHFIN